MHNNNNNNNNNNNYNQHLIGLAVLAIVFVIGFSVGLSSCKIFF